jgi:uroporphyrinogen decarboxylase
MARRFGTDDAVEAFDIDFMGVWPSFPSRTQEWKEAYARLGVNFDSDVRLGEEGYAERVPPLATMGDAWHLTEIIHPLAIVSNQEELTDLPWFDPSDQKPFVALPKQVERIRERGKVSVYNQECTVFEKAWYVRGMENIFEDLIDETGIADWLLDHFTAMSVLAAEQAAAAGVDILRLGDDVGTQHGMLLSVPLWRKVFKPRLAQVIRAAQTANPSHKPLIQYHSDGDVRPILADLVEIGVDILNPVQPECIPLDDIAEEWRDRLAFSGMLGTQTTLPFGTQEDVRQTVQHIRSWAERGAKVLVAPTHVIEPDVPWENILALVEATKS